MSSARIVAVADHSPAADAGLQVGDLVLTINGRSVRDVIEYRDASDAAEVSLQIERGGLTLDIDIDKDDGLPLGIEVHSAVFDRVRTCDNHCEFCFIYQLPKGMRKTLYLKDDDYRLSFLYGNFTTLTRFTEADLERVLTEGLSPLYVSIHATDPVKRSEMLRNKRGGPSLRWLRALLDHGVEVHGQLVVCPDLNDGDVLEDTLIGILDEYPELTDVAIVPLGLSKFNKEPRMRLHTQAEAARVCDLVDTFQPIFLETTGRRLIYAADEYYLLAGRPFPESETYGAFSLHEDGIGMARAFEAEFLDPQTEVVGTQPGFFAWVEGAPAEGYRSPRNEPGLAEVEPVPVQIGSRSIALAEPKRGEMPIGILTGTYGASVLAPLVESLNRPDIRIIEVTSEFFGGNVGVAGLMVAEDLQRVLGAEPVGHRYLLPDVCLSNGQFLDGGSPDDLPRPVEIIETNGRSLHAALTI